MRGDGRAALLALSCLCVAACGSALSTPAGLSPSLAPSASSFAARVSPTPATSDSTSQPTIPPTATATATATTTSTPTTSRASHKTDWQLDLYNKSGVRHQYPDYSACTATSVLIALNLSRLSGNDNGWTVSTDYDTQEGILAYERSHMYQPASAGGSDPLGVKNALNHYGTLAYSDHGFSTVEDAAEAVVTSIARTHSPAIIFPMFGGHSQVVSGYEVTGHDPSVSNDFKVVGVYITDPLRGSISITYDGKDHLVTIVGDDVFVPLSQWKSGSDAVRFTRFLQTDGAKNAHWYGKFVAVTAIP
jgi:hypothetical protein